MGESALDDGGHAGRDGGQVALIQCGHADATGVHAVDAELAAQMQRLRSEFGVYGVDSGRICVAVRPE